MILQFGISQISNNEKGITRGLRRQCWTAMIAIDRDAVAGLCLVRDLPYHPKHPQVKARPAYDIH
jgi:hypothetical protein